MTVNQAAGQADPTATSPIRFDVVFSEPVTGFDAADVILSGTAAGPLTATVTGSGATYTVTVSGMTSRGTVIATIRAGAATDPATDPSFASTSSDNTVTYTTPVTPAAINLACTPGTTAGGAPTMSCTASSADGAVPLHFARVNDLTTGSSFVAGSREQDDLQGGGQRCGHRDQRRLTTCACEVFKWPVAGAARMSAWSGIFGA